MTLVVTDFVAGFVDTLPDAASIVDRDLLVLRANAQFLQLAGLTPRQLQKAELRGACHTQFGLEPCKTEGCLARRAMGLNRAIRLHEVSSQVFPDLKVMWAAIPLPDGNGCIEIFRDVSAESQMQANYKTLLDKEKRRNEILQLEVKKRTADLQRSNDALNRAMQQLSTLARTDPVTMLNNRRVFEEALQRELVRSQRFDRPLSLILFDLDHFKLVNDTKGHQHGDLVLRAFSRLLESAVRQVDIVARFGGEEFIAVLPETDIASAFAIADRIRARQEADGEATVSAGVACAPEHGATAEELIASVDKALYKSKENGRNRVTNAGG